jgi:signal transduction histidine kinase
MRLLTSPKHAATRDEMQALVLRQLSRMSSLVDDLLDASRIANGRLQLQRERLDLRDVVTNAIQTMTPELDTRHHQLAISLPDQPVWLMADPLRLEQVFVNLLGNAAKYTKPGGRLALSIDICGAQVVVRVRDSGIGIAPQHLPYVFELFRQADEAVTQSKSGLGIGLAVVRQLVQLHGGSVTAASPGPGQGSEFTVRLSTIG